MAWMIIRVRGTIHAHHSIVETLQFLRLNRPQHATILPETDEVRGMLTRVQGYVTWGEVDPETVDLLLKKRAYSREGRRFDPAAAPGGAPDPASIAKAGMLGEKRLKPVFRLGAPKGGWRSTKKPYPLGGALGYRGRAINDLARRMV